jgi:uncharacterized protein (DUF608 family)
MSRRQFLELVAVTGAELAMIETCLPRAIGGEMPRPVAPKTAAQSYPLTPPRVYRGKHLEAVAMPLGGIGTGTVWLDGHGRLSVWQIFNNLNERSIPDSFFAVSARSGSAAPVVRALQMQPIGGLKAVESLEYEGGYPIARLKYADAALPVEVQLEAFSPMIPLDAANSAIPCAIFRFTARNTGQTPAEVSLIASQQNAVGSQQSAEVVGVRAASYGGNRNRVVRDDRSTMIAMDRQDDPVRSGSVIVRDAGGREVPGPETCWFAGMSELTDEFAQAASRIAAEGGAILVDGVGPGFFGAVRMFRKENPDLSAVGEVFEDFEKSDYPGWSLTGEAFGKGPSHGTEIGQQEVTGFEGRNLVNTFIAGDLPQGTATSKPFRIQRRFIGFLIGGGSAPEQTAVRLKVDGKVVRSASGKDREALEPHRWDVAEFRGREAVIEILDLASGAWGHINVDQIVFTDISPEPFLKRRSPIESIARAIELTHTGAEEVLLPADKSLNLRPEGAAGEQAKPWAVSKFTRIAGFENGAHGYRAGVTLPSGDPLVIEGPLGKGRITLVMAGGLPWSWGTSLLATARGAELGSGQRLTAGGADIGTLAISVLDPKAAALSAWTKPEQIAEYIQDLGRAEKASAECVSPGGETINGVLAAPLQLKPGETGSATFILSWHFPNARRFQHRGNWYGLRWRDAADVNRYVAENLPALSERTRQYHETVYQSNLPEEFLDAMTSQSVITRGPTCFWSEDGYFGGFEGCYGCCPLNCTHVWNYAQSHARLFPEVGRNMRISNFITFLHADGETSHREHGPHNAFIDGHCACIEAAYREYQMCADKSFLQKIWPGVKKATDWLIKAIDADRDGMPAGDQWNTYDTAVSGANTFIGSQYLSALAASERMALVMDDAESAGRWRTVREAGSKNQNEKLWNGEYYIQLPGPNPQRDYNSGCHADQLLGQWWAHMLGLGYLYPADRVKSALQAVMKYNFREKFAGVAQVPRRYVPDDEGGLLICTWPKGGRPKPFIEYADEVWTGIEYAAAGAMIYEGLIDEARRIVAMARSRYDGRLREGVNSGPGGNPYNELECGKFYARAMSSWSLLVASQGLVLEGPLGVIGFKPMWQPEDHRSFFTAPEAWGLFVQQRKENCQIERIEVRYGRMRVRELVFSLENDKPATAVVRLGDRQLIAEVRQSGRDVRLALKEYAEFGEGETLQVELSFA